MVIMEKIKSRKMKSSLTDIRMSDGSRQFASLPEVWPFWRLREHIAKMAGAVETDFVSDGLVEMWLDFSFEGQRFTVNNQCGEFWFFVTNPNCPDEILVAVVNHFEAMGV